MLKQILTISIFLFAALFILSVPFPHPWIPDIASFIQPVFEGLVKWAGRNIFQIQHPYNSKLISDSTGMYIHLFNLAILSVLMASVWGIAHKKNRDQKLFYWFRVAISYYLAVMLFHYGFSKLFKWQFYLPEPNTLFTTIGNTPRDLLYWSTMGLSRPYTVFAGVIEIIAAVLLLFKRTRLTGALFAFFVLANVVAINFSYDISVKILSGFLLMLSIIIIAPDAGRLWSFLINKKINSERIYPVVYTSIRSKWIYGCIKAFVIACMLFSTLSVYFNENNFNDDIAPRPAFHGAYDVLVFVKNGDTLPPILTDTTRWRRVFVHRRGYFIVQDMADNMQDYELLTDTVNHNFIIERGDDGQQFKLNYIRYPDSTLSLGGTIDKDSIWIELRPIDLEQLPALQHEFNWTIDN